MAGTWKITVTADREAIETALLAHEDAASWDPEIVLSGSEIAPDSSEEWQIEAWLPRKPTHSDQAAIAALFGNGEPELQVERLEDVDWVTESQQHLAPIRAGRFHVHTPDHPASDEPGVIDLTIPASRAFGTGHHETTAGCLAVLTEMKRRGIIVRNCADIGTGTGLLAFAALALWPRALATASDIDATCATVVEENATRNDVGIGGRAGELVFAVADGLAHPLIAARGPYDLIMANILARPLIALMPDFSRALVPGGHLLLAGLLSDQEPQVRRASRRAGLRLAARLVEGDWSILWLRKRAQHPEDTLDWLRTW